MNATETEVERLVDLLGMRVFLETVSRICDGKAEHMAVNWQDTSGAKRWAKAARDVERLAQKVDVS